MRLINPNMNQTFRPPKLPLEVNNINESFTKPAIKVQPELLEHTEEHD